MKLHLDDAQEHLALGLAENRLMLEEAFGEFSISQPTLALLLEMVNNVTFKNQSLC